MNLVLSTITTTLIAWLPAAIIFGYEVAGLMVVQNVYTTWYLIPGNVSRILNKPIWLGCAFIMTIVSGTIVIAGQIMLLGWMTIPYTLALTGLNILLLKESIMK